MLLETLHRINNCQPAPAEILVHVDGAADDCAAAVEQKFPAAQVLRSATLVGPGGGRNKLIAAANQPLIASFDDDSYPIDGDYFARAVRLSEQFPQAAMFCAAVFHRGEILKATRPSTAWVADFAGGACIYRRDWITNTGGYVPIPVAYGMEEVDLALRLHAGGGKILQSDELRVFHDNDLTAHADAKITAASIANIALLTYLRYPLSLWPVGAAQLIRRILWLQRHRRRSGILAGIATIPAHLWRYRGYRQQIQSQAVRSYLQLRRAPLSA